MEKKISKREVAKAVRRSAATAGKTPLSRILPSKKGSYNRREEKSVPERDAFLFLYL